MTPSPYHHTKSDPMTPENLLNRNLLNWPYTPKLLPYYGPQRVTNKAAATSPHMPARQLLFLTKTQQGWKGETSTEWTGKMLKNLYYFVPLCHPPLSFLSKFLQAQYFLTECCMQQEFCSYIFTNYDCSKWTAQVLWLNFNPRPSLFSSSTLNCS